MSEPFDVKSEAAKIAQMCGAWPDGSYAEIIAEALARARDVGAELLAAQRAECEDLRRMVRIAVDEDGMLSTLRKERERAESARDEEKRLRKWMMDDLRSRGLLRESCLGCGRWTDERDCGCPAGTGESLDTRRIVALGAVEEAYEKGATEMRGRCADLARFNDPDSRLAECLHAVPLREVKPQPCATCRGTGYVGDPNPGDRDKGYVVPCPSCGVPHVAACTDVPLRKVTP